MPRVDSRLTLGGMFDPLPGGPTLIAGPALLLRPGSWVCRRCGVTWVRRAKYTSTCWLCKRPTSWVEPYVGEPLRRRRRRQ